MHKVGYFCKELCEDIDSTIYFTEEDSYGCEVENWQYLACEAAEFAWSNQMGVWEWLRDGAVLTLVIDDKEVGDFVIGVEAEPVFTAREK